LLESGIGGSQTINNFSVSILSKIAKLDMQGGTPCPGLASGEMFAKFGRDVAALKDRLGAGCPTD
jgi:hypothetical protein